MQFYSRLTTLRDDFPRLVIALGMFDGVHRGHRSIISRAVELAQQAGQLGAGRIEPIQALFIVEEPQGARQGARAGQAGPLTYSWQDT